MASWFQTNWPYLLTVWVVSHTVAQTLKAQNPNSTAWWVKAARVWSSINPLDIVGAISHLSGQMTEGVKQ